MFATWSGEFIAHTFGRQAIPMVWDFAECNPFSNSTGNWSGAVNWICSAMERFPIMPQESYAGQHDAQTDCGLRNVVISTDPPYYDNIGYADLSDYFYIWLRRSIRDIYPELFGTMLVPKAEELVATPYRFEGGMDEAKTFFEDGMSQTCQQLYKYSLEDVPVTIYYAYRQSDTDKDDKTASSGWETMLSAIIHAGFSITGTWPMRTERTVGIKGHTNMLASSIVLVCRKRKADAAVCTRRQFINELKRELRPALHKLQNSNIAPVDLAQSAIGPGMGVFSKYSQVLDADGTPMTVRSALQIINQELDLYFNEQDSELDSESRFCVDLYSQFAFNEMLFGDANTLKDELVRYLPETWNAIIDAEVDGKKAIPYVLDKNTSRYGQKMAARRVARTIMLGSAPTVRAQNIRGIEASRIRLGVIQPGENIADFNDALNTLRGSLSYLYADPAGNRYWYDTRPTLRKTASDRSSQMASSDVEYEIEKRLRDLRKEAPFAGLHIAY